MHTNNRTITIKVSLSQTQYYMTIRKDDHINKKLDVDYIRSREKLRKFLLVTYAKEDCHIKIRYFVEELKNGKKIYIERPTALNKGCDFVLYAEDVNIFKNGNDKPPSHNDVLQDLTPKKRRLTPVEYKKLQNAIKCIYEVKSYSEAEQHVNNLPQVGWNYELLLKLLRWLFIEQDITYWAGDGRKKLYSAILGVK